MTRLGEAIEVARRAEGFTQEQLADIVGITQAALSRYEHGLREPSDETLAGIAEALGVTPALLRAADRATGGIAVGVHARRRRTAKMSVWRRTEARLNMYRMHASRLFEELDLHATQVTPSFDPFEMSPEAAAHFVRMQWRLPVGPVRSLVQWLEGAGILVIEESIDTPRIDGVSLLADGRAIMLVNAALPVDRRRFTLAHELGHVTLHGEDILTEDPESDANRFAAEFLMPAEVIRPQLRGLNLGRLLDLKRHWAVSMQALIERAYSLEQITAQQRVSLYKQMSAKGWRTNEPASDELADERPALPSAIAHAFSDRGLTPAEVAEITGYAASNERNPFADRRRLRAV